MKRLVLPLTALLAGCAGEPIRPIETIHEAMPNRPAIESIRNWSATGRVAIQRGAEGWSASLQWRKNGPAFQLRLVAPLGRGTYQLAGNGARVELIVPDGGRFQASDAQALMDTHLGWSIPVEGAEFWLRGLIAPGSTPTFINRDEKGQLLDMEQDGWRISVLRRVPVNNVTLPAKLFMHLDDLKVRIVISSWKLASE